MRVSRPLLLFGRQACFYQHLCSRKNELHVVANSLRDGRLAPVTIPSALIERLATAKSVSVLTGAGVSAESGVPTFRDSQTGFWSTFRPEDLATARGFKRDPRMVWEWYDWRRKMVLDAEPNAGHRALAEMESIFPEFHLITQNIDSLHQRAG